MLGYAGPKACPAPSGTGCAAGVFELDENTENVLVDTGWRAKDFGVDLTAEDKPVEPFPLLPHQR